MFLLPDACAGRALALACNDAPPAAADAAADAEPPLLCTDTDAAAVAPDAAASGPGAVSEVFPDPDTAAVAVAPDATADGPESGPELFPAAARRDAISMAVAAAEAAAAAAAVAAAVLAGQMDGCLGFRTCTTVDLPDGFGVAHAGCEDKGLREGPESVTTT